MSVHDGIWFMFMSLLEVSFSFSSFLPLLFLQFAFCAAIVRFSKR